MDTKSKVAKPKKKKFKQTRQLIKLALNDGLVQKQIADTCRVHQSVVSSWNSGSALATEAQLSPLLKIYGHKLRRNSFRIYWSRDPDTLDVSFHKVEGIVILSQSFTDPRRQNWKLIKNIPVHKLVIHDQGRGLFRVVQQTRVKLNVGNEELECSHEDAIWSSTIGHQVEVAELMDVIYTYAKETLHSHKSDALTLPFLITKALLNHGHQIDGIAEYPAVW